MTRGELERAAVEWAREVLEAAWSPSRFRLGPGRASRAVRFVAGRPRVRVEVDVWERVGSGEAALDGGGARFPGVHEPDGVGDAPRDPEEPALRAALESILEAARLAGKSEPSGCGPARCAPKGARCSG